MKILALTHRLPYAPNRGDRIRSYHILRTLARSADVHLFSLADREELRHTHEMNDWLTSVTTGAPSALANHVRGALSLGTDRPLTHALLDAPGINQTLSSLAATIEPDVVFAYCSGMARFTVDGPLQHLPSVLDMVDVDSAKWLALSPSSRPLMKWIYRREGRVLRRFEARAAGHAVTTLVVNERERGTLAEFAPTADVRVVENGVDIDFFRPTDPPADSQEVLFCGVMDYQPNVEGVTWFADSVWPLVQQSVPGARFTVVGSRPNAEVQKLGSRRGITVTGAVDDVRPFLWRAGVSVAPLLTARGLQNKVLEALAAGLPVVITEAVADGLPSVARPGCSVHDDPASFARAVIKVLGMTPPARRVISSAARLDNLGWNARLSLLPEIMSAAKRNQLR